MKNENLSHITAYSGMVKLNGKDLNKIKNAGQKLAIDMFGILVITKDVTPELVLDTIGSIQVHGIVKAPNKVKEVLKQIRAQH